MTMDWYAARGLAHTSAPPLPATTVGMRHALGTTLAEPLAARIAHPPHDTAAMDGYAVAGRAPWRVSGRVLAGEVFHRPLHTGQAVEIATGAMVPEGAEAVLPYEHATHGGDLVRGTVAHGRHLRRAGSEVQAGTELVPEGMPVTPTVLALAASAGHDSLTVRPRPRIAAVVTGDEIVSGGLPFPGGVRDAIGPMLPGLVEWAGARLTAVEHVPDNAGLLRKALAVDADVIVTSGASSVGICDQLPHVLAELPAEVLVNGVACRPGHPQLLARVDGRYVVGLPGNPLAALVAAMTLLEPLVCALARRPLTPLATSTLAEGVTGHESSTRLVPVQVAGNRAEPVGRDRPGMLWGAALADALAVVPPGWESGEVGLLRLPSGNAGWCR